MLAQPRYASRIVNTTNAMTFRYVKKYLLYLTVLFITLSDSLIIGSPLCYSFT